MSKKKKPPVALDMTPMVDIGFLLLIFFMSTTSFKAPESTPIALPQSHSIIKMPEADLILISIGKENQVFWKAGTQPEVAIKVDQMEKAVVDARTRNPKLRIAIKAHKDCDFGTIADIMDVMQKTNNTRFNLVTMLEDDAKKATSQKPGASAPSSQELARR